MLLRRLDRLAALTVIRGLPGTGKTTLAADWAYRRHDDGDLVVWIKADRELCKPEALMRRVWEGAADSGLLPFTPERLAGVASPEVVKVVEASGCYATAS